jgi:hypothetical protein
MNLTLAKEDARRDLLLDYVSREREGQAHLAMQGDSAPMHYNHSGSQLARNSPPAGGANLISYLTKRASSAVLRVSDLTQLGASRSLIWHLAIRFSVFLLHSGLAKKIATWLEPVPKVCVSKDP